MESRNIVIARVRKRVGEFFTYKVSAGDPRGMPRRTGDAEQLLAKDLQRHGINPDDILEIYSERDPCPVCRQVLKRFRNAEVNWTFPNTNRAGDYIRIAVRLARAAAPPSG